MSGIEREREDGRMGTLCEGDVDIMPLWLL